MKTVKIKIWIVKGHYDTHGPFLTKAEADDRNASFGGWGEVVEETAEAILAPGPEPTPVVNYSPEAEPQGMAPGERHDPYA
jgi:hypothetical protein